MMEFRYRPRRRPLLERLGLRPDLTERLGERLGPTEGDGLDVEDAVLRQDMEWLEDEALAREFSFAERQLHGS